MDIIDDDGNLFGIVNIIDVLVLLLVAAVIVAGAVFILSDVDRDETFVTLDLGEQPDRVANQIAAGDAYSPEGHAANLTITDVYRSSTDDGTHVIVRAKLEGEVVGDTFIYTDEPPRLDRELDIQTGLYQVNGTIISVGTEETLQRESVDVVIRDAGLDADEARLIDDGDTITRAGDTIATIVETVSYQTDDPAVYDVYLAAEVETVVVEGELLYAGTTLERGTAMYLDGAGYDVAATVQAVGTDLQRTQLDVVLSDTVTAEEARAIDEGAAVDLGGQTVATFEDVAIYPTGDPDQRSIHIHAQIEALDYGERPIFAGTEVRRGGSLTFLHPEYDLSATVERTGTDLQRETVDVVLHDRASAVDVAALLQEETITVGGDTSLTIADIAVFQTANPEVHDVYIAAEIDALGYGERPHLADTMVLVGESIPIATAAYDLNLGIEAIGTDLQRTEREVLVRGELDLEDAEAVAAGDQAVAAGVASATIETTSTYGTLDPDSKEVFVGVTIETLDFGEQPIFGDTVIDRGEGLYLRTDTYELSGTITRLDTLTERGEPVTETVTFQVFEVHESTADEIEPGLQELRDGTAIAEVLDVNVTPSIIIIEGEDGTLGVHDHPTDRDVTFTVELDARQATEGLRFQDTVLHHGETVTFDFGSITIEAQVKSVG